LGVLAAVAVSAICFLTAAHFAQRDFRPIADPIPPDQAARIASTSKYQRDEDATYLTFPEWYLVFNPQEYARYLAHERPSGFHYFRGIAQMWGGYAEVFGIAQKHYRFNPGYNLMLVVICTSSTVEFAIKGVYENSIGRVFEWTASHQRTAEDDFAAKVAQEYGDFIPNLPWFEFPFGRKFKELWTSTGFFGAHFPRKCERKFFLSLEYGIKTLYAAVIRLASHAVYGTADTEVYLSAHDVGAASLDLPGVRRVQQLGEGRWILTVPHYQGFTDVVPLLARAGVQFDEIAGNNEIMLTLVAPSAWQYDLAAGRPLFTMNLLAGEASKRVAVQVPVKELGAVLRDIEAKKLRLEHLFDY
jgi:hypothetical protein